MKIFYNYMSISKRKKHIKQQINQNGNILTEDSDLQKAVIYRRQQYPSILIFSTLEIFNLIFQRQFSRILSTQARSKLDAYVSLEEVKVALFQIDDNSNPGPDGFGSNFYKVHWEMVKQDIYAVILRIFDSGRSINEANHIFITLVPKKDNPRTISDYRLISYCNVIYKIIANILYNRFKAYMNKLISYNQNAFITG